jgi:hypothetical protein
MKGIYTYDSKKSGEAAAAKVSLFQRLSEENVRLKKVEDECKQLREALAIVERQRDAARGLLLDAVSYAEFSNKIIYGGDGSTWRNWRLSVYLPVYPPFVGSTAREALERALTSREG